MSLINAIAKRIGLDKAIAYSSGARVIQGIAGVGSIFFISTFLTEVEQGFYFTFISILALQIFFELGLNGIMTQYVAHEVSHLSLDVKGDYQGEEKYKSRLASLVQFCVKWYLLLAIIVLIFLIIVGFIYFEKYGDSQSTEIRWRIPWIIICIATSIQLFISPFTSILTGLGFVKETSKVSFFQQMFIPLFTWAGLALGFKLFVLGIGYLVSSIIWIILIKKIDLFKILKKLWITNVSERVAYKKEIFPYQWKIAISWVSGYFMFQLFNPVLFATEGAVVAGQMGLTLAALNSINTFSMSWINTKVPMMSGLIARQEYLKLDNVFSKTLKQMSGICLVLLAVFFLVVVALRITQFSIGDTVFADRFLDYMPMLLMMVPIFLGQFVNAWAIYLRCHKQEPYLYNSIVAGVLCLCSTFFFGNAFGLYGIVIGYCCVRLLLFPWAFYIYKICKKKWHQS